MKFEMSLPIPPARDEPRADVPCGTCRACCRHELVVLFPEAGDDVESYDAVEIRVDEADGPAIHVLKHKDNGDCIYLGEHGCTIHHRAPAVCRTFDCRLFFVRHTRNERRQWEKRARQKLEIFRAGRERLHTLEERKAAHV